MAFSFGYSIAALCLALLIHLSIHHSGFGLSVLGVIAKYIHDLFYTMLYPWHRLLEHQRNGQIYRGVGIDSLSGEIRLLTLHPSDDAGQPLVLNLHKARLSDRLAYQALSYVWGQSTLDRSVYVNGVTVPVTDNLYDALIRLRDPVLSVILWVDKLCINQLDHGEKELQVLDMGKIYQHADRAVCWLGSAREGFDESLMKADLPTAIRTRDKEVLFRRMLEGGNSEALAHITQSPYWERAWTIQEIALARKAVIIYGSFEISRELLFQMHQLWASLGPDQKTAWDPDRIIIEFMSRSHDHGQTASNIKKPIDILHLLSQLRATKSERKRDKIFSVRAMVDEAQHFVQVDYRTKSPHPFETFACNHIQETGSLQVLLYAGSSQSSQSRDHGLPSWIPDWSCNEQKNFRSSTSKSEALFNATKDWKPVAKLSKTTFPCLRSIRGWFQRLSSSGRHIPRSLTLTVKGVIVKRIELYDQARPLKLENILFCRGPFSNPTNMPRMQALLRCILRDSFLESQNLIRLDSGQESMFIRLVIGYFVGLGPTTWTNIMELNRLNNTENTWQAKLAPALQRGIFSIVQEWASDCMEVLEDMMQRQSFPSTDETGRLQGGSVLDRMLNIRDSVMTPPRRPQDEIPAKICPQREESYRAWIDTLRMVMAASSLRDMLTILIGDETAYLAPEEPYPLEYLLQCFLDCQFALGGPDQARVFDAGGYLGVSYADIKAGDVVCVIYGLQLPVVLRPVGTMYQLIGDCFVWGVMDGEVVDQVEAGLLSDEMLELL